MQVVHWAVYYKRGGTLCYLIFLSFFPIDLQTFQLCKESILMYEVDYKHSGIVIYQHLI